MSFQLSSLLDGVVAVAPEDDRKILSLSLDSREITAGALFFACAGERSNGLRYAAEVVSKGAAAIIADRSLEGSDQANNLPIPLLFASHLYEKVGMVSSRFYAYPSSHLYMVGITGTNGKTSCSHYIAELLDSNDKPCAVMGTVGTGRAGSLLKSTYLTTPDPVFLQRTLCELVEENISSVVMEVSSHALAQKRISGIELDCAVFTNLTQDHLDYHGDLEAYGEVKMELFKQPGLASAVINAGDRLGLKIIDALPNSVRLLAFRLVDDMAGLKANAFAYDCVVGRVLEVHEVGFKLQVATPWGEGVINSQLLGRFNASNLLAVLAVLLVKGMPLEEALTGLELIKTVIGRMERFGGEGLNPLVVVDYAHTPDALEKALLSLREHCAGRLICVFGCGGERDKSKRPLMGAVAADIADRLVVTSDNPRLEDECSIVNDILSGVIDQGKVHVEYERGKAIIYALEKAQKEDVVLVAGKGHEEYQLKGEQKLPFSDRDCVQRFFERAA